MQRLLTLFLLTVVISPLAHAQLDSTDKKTVDQAAFQLTKATVEFVATDKLTFGYLPKTTCETCTDYTSLIKFIKASKLAKADELVRDAQKKVAALTIPTATVDQILTGLKQYLHNRATTGDDRERRTKLPSYTLYTTRVATILIGAGVEPGDPVTDNGVPTAAVPADTMDTGVLAAPTSAVTKADAGSIFSYGGIALILSLLNLAALIYLWLQRQAPPRAASTGQNTVTDELSNRVSMLERKHRELANQLSKSASVPATTAERPAPTPESRRSDVVTPKPVPTQPAPQPAQSVQPAPPQPTPTLQPVQAQPVSAQPTPTPQPSFQSQATPGNQPRRREVILYGRTADLGDGFSVASLLTAPDRDTVFQIEVRTDSQAVYRITEEPGAQQLALSDPYSYLADACEYLAKPIPNARIRTDQPGQLALLGDKWRIVEKAKISFY